MRLITRHTEAATDADFAAAMRTHNPVKEGFYEDQAWTFADVYRERTRIRL